MKNLWAGFLRFVKTFLGIFGMLQCLFLLRNCFPTFAGTNGVSLLDSELLLLTALVFSAAHGIIDGELPGRRGYLGLRRIACIVLCILGSAILSYTFNLWGFIPRPHNIQLAIFLYHGSYILTAALVVLAFVGAELHYRKLGKKYDAALAAYKAQSGEAQA